MVDNRRHRRVKFDHRHHVQIMGINGTWARPCVIDDVSEEGAKLTVEGKTEKLALKEFFLLLSSTGPGLAFRKCELIWLNGHQIGVKFLRK